MRGDFRIGERLIRSRLNAIEHDGGTLHIEPKVMQVLVILANHAGEVVTRQQIREQVWQNVFVGDDVLVRAISEIRRALQDDPKLQHTIQTVPKVGYRLIAPVSLPESDASEYVAISEQNSEQLLQAQNAKVAPDLPLMPGREKKALRKTAILAVVVLALLLPLAIFFSQRAGILHFGKHLPEVPISPSVVQSPANSGDAMAAKLSAYTLISGATYVLENAKSRAVLEIPVFSLSNGTLLDQWKDNGGANQHWVAKPHGAYWTFTNAESRKLLDDPQASRNVGVQLDQWQANLADNQNWIVLPVGDGSCKVISQASGLLLDVDEASMANGASILQYRDNDGANQHWFFRLVQKPSNAR
jgi:DNA-binding winged helix-turn-helix (wHTH) protein